MLPVFLTRIQKPRAVLFLAVCLLVLLASSLSPTPAAQVPNSRLAILPELETPVPLCGTPRLIELRDGFLAATLPANPAATFTQWCGPFAALLFVVGIAALAFFAYENAQFQLQQQG